MDLAQIWAMAAFELERAAKQKALAKPVISPATRPVLPSALSFLVCSRFASQSSMTCIMSDTSLGLPLNCG